MAKSKSKKPRAKSQARKSPRVKIAITGKRTSAFKPLFPQRSQKGHGAKKPPTKKSAPARKIKLANTIKIPKPKASQTALKARKKAEITAKKALAKNRNIIRKAPATRPLENLYSLFGIRPTKAKKVAAPKKSVKKKAAPKKPPAKKQTLPKKPARKKAVKGKSRIPQVEPRISVQKLKSGEIKTIAFDVPYKNLTQWLEALEDNPTLDGQIPEGARLGFRFFGNNSLQTFEHIKDALLRIGSYNATLDAIEEGSPEDQADVYRNIEFIIVDSNATWKSDRNIFMEKYQAHKKKRRKSRAAQRNYEGAKWLKLKERHPQAYQKQLARKRAKALARYHRLKNTPGFKAKARKAARKYRRNK